MGYTATSSNGSIYNANSDKAINFIDNAAVGSTMTGGDGSSWTKNADGSTTVVARDGVTTTFGGSAPTLVDSIRVNNVTTGGISGDERAYQVQQAQMAQRLLDQYNSQQSAYAQQLAAQQAAQEAAVQKAVNALESQKTNTEAQYAYLFRQLYVDKMRSRKNLDQQLAARGITGGAAETTALNYDTAYEDALRQGEQGRIGAINSLDQAIVDTRLTGDISATETAASAVREQADAYADTLKYLINRQDSLDARQESYAREDAATARSYAYKTAMQLINAGMMPGARLLESAGIDSAAAQSLVAAVNAEKVSAVEEAAAQAAKPTLTVAQVNAAIKAGVLTDAVLAAYKYYYGEAYRG